MKLFRKIDAKTGNLLEDVLFESHPFLMETVLVDVTDEEGIITQVEETRPILDAEGNPQLDPQYIEEAPPQGLYFPRYLNGVWVEGGQAPEPTPQGPTVEERLQMVEDTIMFMLMGSMQSGLWIKKRPD